MKNLETTKQQFFDNQLVTYEQLSECIKVPKKTLQDWVYKRQIPFVKVGKHIRFKVSEIERWLHKGENQCIYRP